MSYSLKSFSGKLPTPLDVYQVITDIKRALWRYLRQPFLEVNNIHPLDGNEYQLTPGQNLAIKLEDENVPEHAYQVVIYAKIETGYYDLRDKPGAGEMIVSTTIPNGVIERKLICHVYDQQAWSYNSENITLPVASNNRVVNVSLKLAPSSSGKCKASVQIVGYGM
ncbi:uncharacterized protein [Montipora capricornis]|uniref:uncharacterized protein n=1 Tax=Montipora foliosa TaxID=591990 RepID=UPI0035F19025